MGIFDWFRRKKTTPVAPATETTTTTPAPAAKSAAKSAANPAVKAAKPATADAEKQPQCAALTAAGGQCKRSSRGGSKYCGSHKGYRPPAAAVASKAKDTEPAVKGAKDTAPSSRKNSPKKDEPAQAQCAAIAASGGQCKRSSRAGSKYCGSHKGYRVPSAAVAAKAKDTKPAVKKAKDTAPSGRRTQVTHGDYKLFQNGNRFFFSKKAQKDVTGKAVYAMPAGRSVVVTPNGLPVLKKN